MTGAPPRLGLILAETVRATWPEGRLLLSAGAEAAVARAIRHQVRRDRGLPAECCQGLKDWKRGRPEGGFSHVA